MKQVRCERCGSAFPTNDTYSMLGRTFCEPCCDAELDAYGAPLPQGTVFRNCDPTICTKCGKDCVTVELRRVASRPMCETCAEELLHRPFPTWVKLFFAAIFALALVEFARDWRFFQAYFEIPRAYRAVDDGRIADAADLMESAARHVTEHPELDTTARFYRGLQYLQDDRFEEAERLLAEVHSRLATGEAANVESFLITARVYTLIEAERATEAVAVATEFSRKHPQDKGAGYLLLSARIAEAFDSQRYDDFLSLAREREALAPEAPMFVAQVASALACKYAVTGNDAFRLQAMQQLDKACALAGDAPDLKELQERILHRLKTREIITRKEYDRRFRTAAKENTP